MKDEFMHNECLDIDGVGVSVDITLDNYRKAESVENECPYIVRAPSMGP